MSTELTDNARRLREWRRQAGLVEDRVCGVCGKQIIGKNKWACNDCKDKWPCVECGKARPHYSRGMCRPCYQASQYLKDTRRNQRLMKLYGITAEEYDGMLEAQGGRCRGCPRTPAEAGTLHVDHCHRTGRNRGLLCGDCNRVLGLVRDEPETLERLAAYLRG